MPCCRVDGLDAGGRPDGLRALERGADRRRADRPGLLCRPCASLRGDVGRIVLQAGVNVQDTCVVHGFPGSDTLVETEARRR